MLRGPLKRAPVWTAFIKYNIMAQEWLQHSEDKKVLLADLSRFIFTHRYEPQMAPTGEHELHFLNKKGTLDLATAGYLHVGRQKTNAKQTPRSSWKPSRTWPSAVSDTTDNSTISYRQTRSN